MKQIFKKENLLYIVFCIILILILGLNALNKTEYSFFLISILANLFLIIIYQKIIQKLKIEFTKKQKIVIGISIITVYLFYIISILNRNFIYYWDYSCYYNIQIATQEKFSVGLFEGIRYFIGSTWSGEYGNFLSFFPEMAFHFTNHTVNKYLLSCIVVYFPYIIIALAILVQKVIEKIKIQNESTIFNMSLLIFILFPILHATAIYGQPDFFGLAFIFLIIALTINYEFKELEVERLTLILLITFMLIISRRWYLYWVLSYYFCYVIKILITNRKDALGKIIKNILIYGSVVIIFFLITLYPFIKNVLFSNVGNYSDFYAGDGFIFDIKNQIFYLGYLVLFMCLLGIIYGLKKYRLPTILSLIQYTLMVYLFTRIQSMGLHHSLILLPIYIYWVILFLILVLKIKDITKNRICLVISACLIINFLYGICNNTTDNLFTNVSLTVSYQEDYEQLGDVADWLKENLSKDNTAYMITHNNKYNPDKLRNYYLPDKTISNYLPYGSAIIGVHKFPLELFTAKYIIITEPFEPTSVEEKYYKVFIQLVEEEKFKIEKEFDMENGYKILIYKRVNTVTEKEKELYIDALTEESEKYPDLYENIIKSFKI